jgi:hypothetical protein
MREGGDIYEAEKAQANATDFQKMMGTGFVKDVLGLGAIKGGLSASLAGILTGDISMALHAGTQALFNMTPVGLAFRGDQALGRHKTGQQTIEAMKDIYGPNFNVDSLTSEQLEAMKNTIDETTGSWAKSTISDLFSDFTSAERVKQEAVEQVASKNFVDPSGQGEDRSAGVDPAKGEWVDTSGNTRQDNWAKTPVFGTTSEKLRDNQGGDRMTGGTNYNSVQDDWAGISNDIDRDRGEDRGSSSGGRSDRGTDGGGNYGGEGGGYGW